MVVVAVVAWTAARMQSEPHVDEPVVTPAAVPVTPPTFEPEVPRVQHVAFSDGAAGRERNIFSYVEPPPPPVEVVIEPEPVPVEMPKAVVEVETAREPEPPAFHYRYLGRFGRDAAPLAAFSRDGEVVVRRAGERIDAQFVLLRIGAEAVDIAAEQGTQRVVRRVPIGD